MEKVTGIGGMFFRAKDPKSLAAWYEQANSRPGDPGARARHRGARLAAAYPDSTRKEPHMRHNGLVVVALVFAGCTPARAYMNDVNSPSTIAEAERLIADAQQAGADSLATETITAARQALESARSYERGGQRSRAQIDALRAQAEARYARATAERELAQREQARARDELAAMPPGGAR